MRQGMVILRFRSQHFVWEGRDLGAKPPATVASARFRGLGTPASKELRLLPALLALTVSSSFAGIFVWSGMPGGYGQSSRGKACELE